MLHTWMVGTIVVQGSAPADITINDSLTITGSIDNYDSNQFDYFNFLIISSTGMAISESGNFIPQLNGNFATEINLGGLGVSSGTYTLVSNFNGVQSTTTFNYYPGIGEIDKTIFIENEIIPEPEPVVNTSQDFLTITGSIINYDSIEYNSAIVIMIKLLMGILYHLNK